MTWILICLVVVGLCYLVVSTLKLRKRWVNWQKQIIEDRRLIGNKLIEFATEYPPPLKEQQEWIKIARFCDDQFFHTFSKGTKNFERLEDTARKIFKNRVSN